MARIFHFISGLPRSGSTLLCAILRQNPRFHAAMTSPLASMSLSLIEDMSPPSQFAAFFDDQRRRAMLRGLFDAYHNQHAGHEVVFDTNRIWTGQAPLLADLYPNCRIICCVREIGWIIDSIERMLRRNPLQASRIFEGSSAQTIYARMEALMNAEIGFIGAAWSNLREAWFSELSSRLLLVSYDGLVRDPARALRRLYAALGEPAFAHDFDNVGYDEPEYDAALAMPGLHTVASKVAPAGRMPAIPPDIFNQYAASAFWRTAAERLPAAHQVC